MLELIENKKKSVFVSLFLLGLALVVFYYSLYDTNSENEITTNEEDNHNITKYMVDRWQYIGDPSKLFSVYSAYFDERLEFVENYICPYDHICYGTVQTIALLVLNIDRTKLYCNYKYSDGSVKTKIVPSKMIVLDFWGDHRCFMITCVLTQYVHERLNPPEAVGLTYEKEPSMVNPTVFTYIRYPTLLNPKVEPQHKKNEIAACVNDFHDQYSNTLRIVEFIELNKLLGVTKFYFYNNSVSPEVSQLLNYYVENENAEVLDWNAPTDNGKLIDDHALHACANDCYFRASFMGNYKYVLLIDIDEFIIPFIKNVTTLTELMKKLDIEERFSAFRLGHSFVSTEFADEDENSENFTNKYLYTQNNIRRAIPLHQDDRWLTMPRSKIIGKGKYIRIVNLHSVKISVKNKIERLVPLNDALLFHYRETQQTSNFSIKDTTVLKYGIQLRKNVDDVCSKVFSDGICPSKFVADQIKKKPGKI